VIGPPGSDHFKSTIIEVPLQEFYPIRKIRATLRLDYGDFSLPGQFGRNKISFLNSSENPISAFTFVGFARRFRDL